MQKVNKRVNLFLILVFLLQCVSISFLAAAESENTIKDAPAAITLGIADITGISAAIAWTSEPADINALSFDIYRDDNLINTVSGAVYTDTGLSPGNTYKYKVKARDGAGNILAESNELTVTTLTAPVPAEPSGPEPEAPTTPSEPVSDDPGTTEPPAQPDDPANPPTPADIPAIRLQMYNSKTNDSSNTIYFNYMLYNEGTVEVDLKDIKIRYYYTSDGDEPQNYWCDWSSAGTSNITGDFGKMDPAMVGADSYLEIGFKNDRETLAPGQSIEIKSRIANADWSNYRQSNDYSFNGSANAYADWDKSTVYLDGDLLWGQEPAEMAEVEPPLKALKIQMYNNDRNETSNTISPNYRLYNTGNTAIDLKNVKIRYYYMVGGNVTQNFWCDWSSAGTSNVGGTIVRNADPKKGADTYVEITFSDAAGTLAAGGNVEIKTRFARNGWKNYVQSDDYSFNSNSRDYADWEKVTAYVGDELVWGTEPSVPFEEKLAAKVQMYNSNRQSTSNTISPRFMLYNTGTIPFELKDVTIRYYYTIDGDKPQNFWCDWSDIGAANVTARFVKIPFTAEGADYYYEVGFKGEAGTLIAGDGLELQTRFAKTDWTDYKQSDDYSFNAFDSKYTDWSKVGVYIGGKLVWGEVPVVDAPQNINFTATEETISLSWDEVAGASGYDIEADGLIKETASDSFTDAGLLPGTGHVYRIRAKNAVGAGEWSKQVSAFTVPSAVSNITAVATQTEATVTWDKTSGATGYDIEFNGNIIEDVDGPYIQELLIAGTEYGYRVRAKNSGGAGKWSEYQTIWTIPGVAEKIDFTAYETEIDLSWEPVQGATVYDLELDGNVVSDISNSFIHRDLQPGTEHIYRVRAKNSSGAGSWKIKEFIWTLPEMPRNIHFTASETEMAVLWDDVTGATSYDVEFDGQVAESILGPYLHSGLEAGSEHSFRVRAKNSSGEGAWSNAAEARTIPGEVRNILSEATEEQIVLEWEDTEGAAGYDVEFDGEIIYGAVSPFTRTSLRPGTEHVYRIRAKNESGLGSWSDAFAKCTLPGIPQNIAANAGSKYIELSWDTVEGAEGYDVEVLGTAVDNNINTAYIHNNLNPNTQYVYRIRAKNSSGEGQWSPIIAKTTLSGTPGRIETVSGGNSIEITWEPVSGAESYDIEVDGNEIYNLTDTHYLHKNLAPDSSHRYRIRSRTGEGESEWSDTVIRNTLLDTPSVSEPSKSGFAVTLTWEAVNGASAYEVDADGTVLDNGASTSFKHDGLEPNTVHIYRVRAKNGNTVSAWSDYMTTATLPEKPVNLSGTAESTALGIKWDMVAGAAGYEIELDGEVIDNGMNNTYYRSGLPSGKEYLLRVRAYGKGGYGEWSEAVSVKTLVGHPQNIVTASSGNSILISWDEVSGATGYDVMVDGEITDNGPGKSFRHEGLKNSSVHVYSVRSKDGSLPGDWSGAVVAETLVGTPSNISLSAGSVRVKILWDKVDGAAAYDIEADNVLVGSTDKTGYTHEPLEPNTGHTYRIRAKSGLGEGEWSSAFIVSTTTPVPGNIRAEADTDKITLAWDTAEGAAAYDVEVDGIVIGDIHETSYTHTGLKPNTKHTYRVRSKNAGTTGGWSDVLVQNTVPEVSIGVKKDNVFNFVIVIPPKPGANERTVVLTYDAGQLEVMDLCAATAQADLETGTVSGTNITILEFSPGKAVFKITGADRTNVNIVKFLSNTNENSSVTYRIE